MTVIELRPARVANVQSIDDAAWLRLAGTAEYNIALGGMSPENERDMRDLLAGCRRAAGLTNEGGGS
jgi:hypothetical protein